jgi:hypothetical protein
MPRAGCTSAAESSTNRFEWLNSSLHCSQASRCCNTSGSASSVRASSSWSNVRCIFFSAFLSEVLRKLLSASRCGSPWCLKMPLACPVEFSRFFSRSSEASGDATGLPSGVSRFESCQDACTPKREPPPGKPVASRLTDAMLARKKRESPPGKPVASLGRQVCCLSFKRLPGKRFTKNVFLSRDAHARHSARGAIWT